jgi:hypothetical protein|tara:strand:+ start:58 stop:222 length:165 start_codon:yes stop_codon:yes gene_type:complete
MAKKPKTPNEIIEAIEDLHSQEQDLLEQLKKNINSDDDSDDDFDDDDDFDRDDI